MYLLNLIYFFCSLFSYCGAQIFEIYGLGKEIVDLAFSGSVSKIGGLTFDEVRITTCSLSLIVSWYQKMCVCSCEVIFFIILFSNLFLRQ